MSELEALTTIAECLISIRSGITVIAVFIGLIFFLKK